MLNTIFESTLTDYETKNFKLVAARHGTCALPLF